MSGRTIPASLTEAPGNYITSALWNGQITNGVYSFCFNPPYFKGIATISQALSSTSTFSAITLTSAVTDTEGGWSSGSPTIYTVQTAGRYMVIGSLFIPTNGASDTTSRGVGIWVSSNPTRIVEGANAPNVGFSSQAVLTTFLSVGTTVGLFGMQQSGISLSTQVANAQQQPQLELIWMGAH